MNGSNQSSCNPAPSTSQNIAPHPYQYDNAPFNVHLAPVNNHLGPPSISQPPLTTVNWPADMTSPDSTFDQAVGGLNSRRALHTKVDHIEQIASWADIGFFLSLHLRFQHALVPLVHKPTFAQDILNRRDENDEAFRALLLSIGTCLRVRERLPLTLIPLFSGVYVCLDPLSLCHCSLLCH